MINIKLIKVFIFILILSIFYNFLLSEIFNFSYSLPHFSSSFKPINGYLWESSELNILLLIKLYGIYLLTSIKKINLLLVIIYTFLLEIILLGIFKKSSFIVHGTISIIFFNILKKSKNLKV